MLSTQDSLRQHKPEAQGVIADRPVAHWKCYPDFSPWSRAEVKLSDMRGDRGSFRVAGNLYAQRCG